MFFSVSISSDLSKTLRFSCYSIIKANSTCLQAAPFVTIPERRSFENLWSSTCTETCLHSLKRHVLQKKHASTQDARTVTHANYLSPVSFFFCCVMFLLIQWLINIQSSTMTPTSFLTFCSLLPLVSSVLIQYKYIGDDSVFY